MKTSIRGGVFKRNQLWTGRNGSRDYIKVGDEIYSINGLYSDHDGVQNRWVRFVEVIDSIPWRL